MLNLFNLFQSNKLNENSDIMYHDGTLPSMYLTKIAQFAEGTRSQMVTNLAYKDAGSLNNVTSNLEEIKAWTDKLEKTNLNDKERASLNSFKEVWSSFDERVKLNMKLMENGQWDEVEKGIKAGGVFFGEAREHFGSLVEMNDKKSEAIMKANEEVFASTIEWSIILMIVCSMIAIVIAYGFTKYIIDRLTKVVNRVEEIEVGNLQGNHLVVVGKDEIATLSVSLNNMQQKLREVVSGVLGSSQNVTGSSEELSASAEESMAAAGSVAHLSQQSADGADDQLHSVNEISVAVEEMVLICICIDFRRWSNFRKH